MRIKSQLFTGGKGKEDYGSSCKECAMPPWPVVVMNSLSDAITMLDSYISFFVLNGVVEAITILI